MKLGQKESGSYDTENLVHCWVHNEWKVMMNTNKNKRTWSCSNQQWNSLVLNEAYSFINTSITRSTVILFGWRFSKHWQVCALSAIMLMENFVLMAVDEKCGNTERNILLQLHDASYCSDAGKEIAKRLLLTRPVTITLFCCTIPCPCNYCDKRYYCPFKTIFCSRIFVSLVVVCASLTHFRIHIFWPYIDQTSDLFIIRWEQMLG